MILIGMDHPFVNNVTLKDLFTGIIGLYAGILLTYLEGVTIRDSV
jgi:hypothetical protein